MTELVIIVPSRGRPGAAVELAETCTETCTANTSLVFAVDSDDPERDGYGEVIRRQLASVLIADSTSMVDALNRHAVGYADLGGDLAVEAIAFMGDDHRPRTSGWDKAYLEALRTKPGLVYGDDRIQGARLPTQVAISASIIRALGHMAPPVLTHLYVDNYWMALGRATGRITYLPEVVVEHLHPVAGTAEMDDGYRRVNAPAMYQNDSNAYADYWHTHGARDIRALRQAVAA